MDRHSSRTYVWPNDDLVYVTSRYRGDVERQKDKKYLKKKRSGRKKVYRDEFDALVEKVETLDRSRKISEINQRNPLKKAEPFIRLSIFEILSEILNYARLLICLAEIVICLLTFFQLISREVAVQIHKVMVKFFLILSFLNICLASLPLALLFIVIFLIYKNFTTVRTYLVKGFREYLHQVKKLHPSSQTPKPEAPTEELPIKGDQPI